MDNEPAARAGSLGWLGAGHDLISRLCFDLASALLGLIVLSFSFEVVARYAFNAPTEWAVPLVSYLLAASIFLAMPELTRRSAHVSINVLIENAPPLRAKILLFVTRVLAAGACLLAAWISGEATLSQYTFGYSTNPPLAVPKWCVSIFVPFGMLSSSIYFLRQLVSGAPATDGSGEQL